jgi:A/G-specific adenine glycosylase
VTSARSPRFAARIIAWQQQHGRRDLPWQRTRDAYRIWLAEVMLQQTQVATVIPYYERFLRQFPDVRALAAAPPESVMAAWAGLGYYSRARLLHRCARLLVDEHRGEFPSDALSLSRLPGIGRSTAAAIAAFAGGERAAILDGNVKRVLARQFGIEGYPGEAPVERALWALAETLLPDAEIEGYTQGLMDLGATVCTRSRPKCEVCPVADSCVARGTGRIEVLPTPRPVRTRPVRIGALLVIRDATGAVLLEPRPPRGIWGGLLSLPEFDAEADDETLIDAAQSRYALRIRLADRLASVRHEFTHFSFVMQPRIADVLGASGAASNPMRFLALHELDTAPLPAPIRRLLRGITAAAELA